MCSSDLEEKHRVSLGIKQLTEDPWANAIPSTYMPGQVVKGAVTKLTNFGVFIQLEEGLEGLLHISELSDEKVDSPQDVVKIGDELEVKILRVDTDSRKIGLSLRRVQWAAEDKAAEGGAADAPIQDIEDTDAAQRRGGLDGELMPDSLNISLPTQSPEEEA